MPLVYGYLMRVGKIYCMHESNNENFVPCIVSLIVSYLAACRSEVVEMESEKDFSSEMEALPLALRSVVPVLGSGLIPLVSFFFLMNTALSTKKKKRIFQINRSSPSLADGLKNSILIY